MYVTSSDKRHTGKFNCLRRTTASALASIGSESEYNFACKFMGGKQYKSQ